MPAAVAAAPIAGVAMIMLPATAAAVGAAAAVGVVGAGPEVGQGVEDEAHGGNLGTDRAGGREDEGVGRG